MKVLLDTSIYIDFLRDGRHPDLVSVIDRLVLSRLYMSSIVAHELLRGTRRAGDLKSVDQLVSPFRFRQRLLNPPATDWIKAAAVIRALRRRLHLDERCLAGMVQDSLLAVQAHSVGARLITTDTDFRLIRKVHDFELELRAESDR